MAFVKKYIIDMAKEPPRISSIMLTRLQELMEDGEMDGWPAVRVYHAAWLQQIEQGHAAWGDKEAKLKFR